MVRRYGTIDKLIEEGDRLVRSDWDNGYLVTGKVGTGKSTVLAQVLKAHDAEFDVPRIHFTIQDALAGASEVPRYGAWALDEAHISGRKAMHGEVQRLNDYLQVNRGLNHHWGLCFHNDRRVDKVVMERVRLNLHLPRRGLFQVRVLKEGYEKQSNPWRVVDAFSFKDNRGAFKRRYKAKKDAHMRSIQAPEQGGSEGLGVDEDALEAGIQALKGAL